MASARGLWLRDQIPVRFGAWFVTAAGTPPSVTAPAGASADSGVEGGCAASSWRAVVLNGAVVKGARLERCRAVVAAATRSREAYMVDAGCVEGLEVRSERSCGL